MAALGEHVAAGHFSAFLAAATLMFTEQKK